jgi:hypothetical protein
LTDVVLNRFERIIGKLRSCNVDPELAPDWITALVRRRFGQDCSLPDNLGRYLGAYLGADNGAAQSSQIYFFERGFGFVDSALRFPVYLRFTDIASFDIPPAGSASRVIRIRDKHDLLSCLSADHVSGDLQEVGRFFIRMHEPESDSSLVL